MKKLIFISIFILTSIAGNAQSQGNAKYDYYIDVYLDWGGKNYIPHVSIDNESDSEVIYDESGEKLKFKNRSSVINYFSKLGWKFVQAARSTNNQERFLFMKEVKTDEEAKTGFIFKK